MRMRIFPLSVVGCTAVLAGSALGQPVPLPAPRVRPPQQVTTPSCNAGQAPMVKLETRATYVHLSWQSVPNAVEYHIDRSTSALPNQFPVVLPQYMNPQNYYQMTEYWDAVPDPRYAYIYAISAIRADHCYGTTTVTVPSSAFSLPNPTTALARRLSAEGGDLSWSPVFGAVAYRVDGPGMSVTMQGGISIEGVGPRQTSYSSPLYSITPPAGCPGCTLGMQTKLSTNGGQFQITALYPGNFADYQHPTLAAIPLVLPCVLYGSAPVNGYAGTTVTIQGSSLRFADQVHFIMDQKGDWFAPASASDGSLTVSTAGFAPLQGNSPFTGKFSVHTPAGWCVGPTYFEVLAGTPPPPPPPPPPPATTPIVPSVVGDLLPNAVSQLQQTGFVATPQQGPWAAQAVVTLQSPLAGSHAAKGSRVYLTTTATAAGYSKVTLQNGSGQPLSVWVWDATTQTWITQSSSFAAGAEMDVSFSTIGHTYIVYVDNDVEGCTPQNLNDNCIHWQNSYPGDPNGPPTYQPIS